MWKTKKNKQKKTYTHTLPYKVMVREIDRSGSIGFFLLSPGLNSVSEFCFYLPLLTDH